MAHGLGLVLGIHHHPMPDMQCDGGMISVADAATYIDTGVTGHDTPAPLAGAWRTLQQHRVLVAVQPCRMFRADVDRLATSTVAELGPVRLASTAATERFVLDHQLLVDYQCRFGQKEPFTLTQEGGVLTAVTLLGTHTTPALGLQDVDWLERFLGLPHRSHGGSFGDSCHKPVAFIVTAEELVLVALLAGHQ